MGLYLYSVKLYFYKIIYLISKFNYIYLEKACVMSRCH